MLSSKPYAQDLYDRIPGHPSHARRNQCKTWWNDEWRDRILAVMAHLADENGHIQIPIASNRSLRVSSWPETFESAVTYADPEDFVKEEEMDDYDFEEPEVGDEAEELDA